MSVLASKRKESRFEPVVFSLDQLIGKEATTTITEKKKGGRKGGF